MSRITRTRLPPPRTSLRCIGIPDAHDALAVYFRWVRQARYYRADAAMGPEGTSSVAALHGEQQLPLAPVARARVVVDGASLSRDLTCVGAWAEAGRMEGYPLELDILA
ncbi:hypothetical protein CC86DRAFT_367111 [Ophiobolus disseminans]|uniref:Uncharacterized protein n=1 Tax=Ophiobolus disseminans TaxID=1469910 RepID=A0A6A7AAT8_9PLEO|nr:hypothetical protein CC86DRAFT_367111 [Ophiobolus disseminans]